jgi:hypothetical protein
MECNCVRYFVNVLYWDRGTCLRRFRDHHVESIRRFGYGQGEKPRRAARRTAKRRSGEKDCKICHICGLPLRGVDILRFAECFHVETKDTCQKKDKSYMLKKRHSPTRNPRLSVFRAQPKGKDVEFLFSPRPWDAGLLLCRSLPCCPAAWGREGENQTFKVF